MTKVLLTIHVLAAIIAIGPVTVAASMFPAAVRRADLPALRILHRICRVYAALGVLVPVFGLATATSLGALGDAWLRTSIGLTLVAAAVLIFLILPGQSAALTSLSPPPTFSIAAVPEAAIPTLSEAAVPTLSEAAVSEAAVPAVSEAAIPEAAVRAASEAAVPEAAVRADPAGPAPAAGSPAARLGMATGIFNLLWAVVVVLMIVRPGSTTGA